MRIGLYTFASLAFIGLVAGVTYAINPNNYVYEVAGINLNFPIALWVAAPMLLLLIMTVFHMIYYGTKSYISKRRWLKNTNEMQDALYWSLLGEPKKHNYTIPQIKSGAAILSVSSLDVKDTTEGLSDKLGNTLNWIMKIKNGEFVDLKAKKVEKYLSKNNPILVKNQLNQLDSDKSFMESVLSDMDSYDDSVVDKALDLLAKNETLFKMRKYVKAAGMKRVTEVLDRADMGEDVGVNVDNIEYIADHLKLSCADYIRLAQSSIKILQPDENLEMFKKFAKENEKAQSAYLMLLFQYEMIDEAKAFLEEHSEDDFKPFRAFYALKKGKYKYRVSDLLNTSNLCNGN